MKKIFLLSMLMLLVFCLSTAHAEAGSSGMPVDFVDWTSLQEFTTMVSVVVIVVQLCKQSLDKLMHIPTQFLVYVISLMLALLTQTFAPEAGGLTWSTGILACVNAFFVAITAMYIYEHAIAKVEEHKLLGEYAFFNATADTTRGGYTSNGLPDTVNE